MTNAHTSPIAAFSPSIQEQITRLLASPPPGSFAAFDGDGTLWDGDVNETLIANLADAGLLPRWSGTGAELLHENERRLAADRRTAYTWAVEILAGLPLATLLAHSGDMISKWTPHIRPAMRGLVALCESAGVPAYLVSASNRWTVAQVAPLAGIDPARTFGIATAVDAAGILGDTVVPPVTCFEGKVEALQRVHGAGARPLLAAGDSMGDIDLLSSATGLALVVGREDTPANELQRIGQARGWPIHRFASS